MPARFKVDKVDQVMRHFQNGVENGLKSLEYRIVNGEWDESKHDRDESGKFGSGGGEDGFGKVSREKSWEERYPHVKEHFSKATSHKELATAKRRAHDKMMKEPFNAPDSEKWPAGVIDHFHKEKKKTLPDQSAKLDTRTPEERRAQRGDRYLKEQRSAPRR